MPNGSILFKSPMSLFNPSNKTSGPWPLVVASKFIDWSIKQEKIEFNDRIRVLPEEDALGNGIAILFSEEKMPITYILHGCWKYGPVVFRLYLVF